MQIPPIKTDDGNPAMLFSVRVEIGPVVIAAVTEGAGAFIEMRIDDPPARLDPKDIDALARWAAEACDELDRNNKEGEYSEAD